MRLALCSLLSVGLLAAGCGGNDSAADSVADSVRSTASVATPTPTVATSAETPPPSEDETAINSTFERSYSECSTEELTRLAAKYSARQTSSAIATAVGRGWARQFAGGPRAQRAGRDGCLQALRERD